MTAATLPRPADTITDFDAALTEAAAHPDRVTHHDRWQAWIDELLERRLRAA